MTTMHFEAKKHAYRQTQDGIVVSFVVHPNDVCADLAIAPLGTQYIVALAPYTEEEHRPPSSTGPEHGASIPAVGGSNPPADTTPAPKERRPFHTLPRSQQAAILINDAAFQSWVGSNRTPEETDQMLKAHMGIASKRDLDQPAHAEKWDRMVATFRADAGRQTWERPA